MSKHATIVAGIVLLILSLIGANADAAVYTWGGTASGAWSTAANWSPNGTLAAGNTAWFNGAGNSNTTIDVGASGTMSITAIVFDTGSCAAYTIGSGGAFAQSFTLANSGSITVNSAVTNNQTFNANIYLGDATAQTYTFTNNSTSSLLTFAGNIKGGTGGTAGAKTLAIAGNGNITISGTIGNGGASSLALTKAGAGTLTLSGSNSYSGNTTINSGTLVTSHSRALGSGNVYVNSGALAVSGSLSTGGIGVIGYNTGSSGTANVSGTGSTWTNSGNLYVGNYGIGSLTVSDGGSVSDAAGVIGSNSGASGTAAVTGTGSTWTNSNALYVGYSGNGSLTVSSGGQVSNTYGYIGFNTGSSGTSTVTGTGSKWTNSSNLYVGNSGIGSLTVSDGGSASNTIGYIGNNTGSSGTATVTGTGSKWTNSGNLYVGYYGNGSLTVSDGGSVSDAAGVIGNNSGSNSTATVTGTGSTWNNSAELYIGPLGTGSLTVSNGGQVKNTNGYIGANAGSNGTVNVTGTGSTWTNSGNLSVGNSGIGSLTVSDGGAVSNTIGYIGYSTGSNGTVTVTGTGSTWTNNTLSVGSRGNGSLTVSDGGAVSNTNGSIGYYAGSNGTVTVTGTGSTWTNSSGLDIGTAGRSTLTIADGGTVTSTSGGLLLANGSSSIGTVNLDGGTLNVSSIAKGLGTGKFYFNGGTLKPSVTSFTMTGLSGACIRNGGAIIDTTAGSVTIAQNLLHSDIGGDNATDGGLTKMGTNTLTLSGANVYNGATNINGGNLKVNGSLLSTGTVYVNNTGTLSGAGHVGTVYANSGGIVAPGNSVGTLNVDGNYTFGSGSTYQVETNATTSDLIAISGTATIQSNANITFSGVTGAGNYVLATAASGLNNGTFTGAAPLNYTLKYSATELDLQRKATATVGTLVAASSTIITGGSTGLSIDVQNSAPTGSENLSFTLGGGTGVTGADLGSKSLTPAGSATNYGNLSFSSTSLGSNAVAVSVTPAGSTDDIVLNRTANVTVLDHGNAALGDPTNNNQTIITGGALSAVTVDLTNAGTNLAGLSVGNLSNLSGLTGTGAVVANNGSGTYTATGFDTTGVGVSKTLTVSLKAGDQQDLSGYGSQTTLSKDVTYTVLGHSSPSLSDPGVEVNLLQGAVQTVSTQLHNASGDVAQLEVVSTDGMSGANVGDLIGAGSYKTLTAAVNTGTMGTVNSQYTIGTCDQQNLSGCNTANADQVFTVTGVVGWATADNSNDMRKFGTALIAVVSSGGSYNGLASLVHSDTVGSGGAGKLGSEAVLSGTNSTGVTNTVSMAWRTRTTAEASIAGPNPLLPAEAYNLVSDVVNLSGLGTNEKVSLTMVYDPNQLVHAKPLFTEEYLAGGNPQNIQWIYLARLNDTTNMWEKVDGSIADAGTHTVTATGLTSGTYAVVPEPGTMTLLLIGGVGVLLRRRRK